MSLTKQSDAANLAQIGRDGFAMLRAAVGAKELARLRASCDRAFGESGSDDRSIRASREAVYAARNVTDLIPESRTIWNQGPLRQFLRAVLGDSFGLVRALYFDKPPERTWSLPWHKDLSIAVKDNALPSRRFSRPTNKGGVPHVIASAEVLAQMLTLRIHLDDANAENGALRVIPGSHLSDQDNPSDVCSREVMICALAGDVLAMRPMLTHASSASRPGTKLHRRILHLEFSAAQFLGDGIEWYQFLPS